MHQSLVRFPTVGTRIEAGPSHKELHAGSLESILLWTGEMICEVSRIELLSIKSARVTPVDVVVFMMR